MKEAVVTVGLEPFAILIIFRNVYTPRMENAATVLSLDVVN